MYLVPVPTSLQPESTTHRRWREMSLRAGGNAINLEGWWWNSGTGHCEVDETCCLRTKWSGSWRRNDAAFSLRHDCSDENAKVGFVFAKRGLTMECLSSTMLERCVGHKKAMEFILTGRIFRARDGPAGLFNYTVPSDQVMPKAIELCHEICDTSPMSAMLNRHMVIRNRNLSPEEAHLIESRSIYWVSRQADCQEGVKSFLEKRALPFLWTPLQML